MSHQHLNKIQSILHGHCEHRINCAILDEVLSKVAINLEAADETTVVFYHLGDGSLAEEKILARLQTASYGLLVVNRYMHQLTAFKNIVVATPTNFFTMQIMFADLFYPTNFSAFKVVGVTGTNGKTSVVNLAAQIARFYAKNVLAIGTLGVQYNLSNLDSSLYMTTPSYLDLRKILFQYQPHLDVVFMEVSSHALAQGRLGNIRLDQAAWTSFSQDHLDYHRTMEEYLAAKKKIVLLQKDANFCLFVPPAVPFTAQIADLHPRPAPPLALEILQQLPFHFQVQFNRHNLELAWALNQQLWGESSSAVVPWQQLALPPGRFESISAHGVDVVIDYAHTPDALENICQGIRETFPARKLTIIFGCGGDRDRSKRPRMGAIATKLGDWVAITSDNPRSESPKAIIDEIVSGAIRNNYVVIVDRRQAIWETLSQIAAGDIILIAGKGHEDYQEISGVKHSFSDKRVVFDFFAQIKNK